MTPSSDDVYHMMDESLARFNPKRGRKSRRLRQHEYRIKAKQLQFNAIYPSSSGENGQRIFSSFAFMRTESPSDNLIEFLNFIDLLDERIKITKKVEEEEILPLLDLYAAPASHKHVKDYDDDSLLSSDLSCMQLSKVTRFLGLLSFIGPKLFALPHSLAEDIQRNLACLTPIPTQTQADVPSLSSHNQQLRKDEEALMISHKNKQFMDKRVQLFKSQDLAERTSIFHDVADSTMPKYHRSLLIKPTECVRCSIRMGVGNIHSSDHTSGWLARMKRNNDCNYCGLAVCEGNEAKHDSYSNEAKEEGRKEEEFRSHPSKTRLLTRRHRGCSSFNLKSTGLSNQGFSELLNSLPTGKLFSLCSKYLPRKIIIFELRLM
ncbi:unnamed protein product [Protopolystoma xenopodis]|uniref:Uncharacterized protein n=1 Tax=Protopolystoma xenopodis TaxID=117903 RepID=A0A448XBF4_9PLAT|nr:unnamed protein product [Protopolystoma xenopodis]